MPSWRARRQIIVLFIIALPFVGLGFLLVPKFLPEPTCFDNRRNQGEVDIDCGGPCAPCELRMPKPITVFWARAVLVRPDLYDVAAEIQNASEVLSSTNVEYEFALFDEIGLIALRTGRVFLYAQERMHVVETNLSTTREPTRVEFKIVNAEWQFRQEPRPALAVERRDYTVEKENDGAKSVVEAAVFNRTLFDFREAEVRFAVLDKDGNLLGVNRILIENFLSGSRRTVRSIWPERFKGEAAEIIVEPRVNIFDTDAILKPR